MKRYELYSPKTGVTVMLDYGSTLGAVNFGEATKADFWAFVIENMFTVEQMKETAKKFGYKVTPVAEEQAAPTPVKVVDFEGFWEEYNYKVDKKRAQDKWKRLKPAEQLAAYSYVARYKSELARTGVAQMYAKSYLTNKVWEV